MARAKKKYYVYVIELDKKVKSFRKIRQANPQRLSNKPCVYIGQSYYPPEIRFEQHKEGYKSNKYAKEYGIALKPELYDKYNPIPTRKDAEEIEAWLAKELRKKGYTVWYG
ncbi:MAG: hypothetical protein IIB44_06610 [Candidatus Marinimicrobia bacterium]|nr:hypothetical protein [Candidatus Neomarinimicrobiota bacterium]